MMVKIGPFQANWRDACHTVGSGVFKVKGLRTSCLKCGIGTDRIGCLARFRPPDRCSMPGSGSDFEAFSEMKFH
jgi:hypothetical protein